MNGKHLLLAAAVILAAITASTLYAQRGSLFRQADSGSGLSPEELALPLKQSEVTVSTQFITNQTSLDIIISNPHSETISFGRQYDIYKLENGTWKPYPNPHAWYLDTIGIGPGGVFTQTDDITGFPSGRYKVVKTLEYPRLANGTIPKFQAEAEFLVVRPATKPGN